MQENNPLVTDLMSYKMAMSSIRNTLENAKETAKYIQNDTQKTRFITFLEELSGKFEVLATQIEKAKPIRMQVEPIKKAGQRHANEVITFFNQMEKAGFDAADRDFIVCSLESIKERYQNVFVPQLQQQAVNDKPPEDPKIMAIRQSVTRACFNHALMEVKAKLSDFKVSLFINYAWGVAENVKKIK